MAKHIDATSPVDTERIAPWVRAHMELPRHVAQEIAIPRTNVSIPHEAESKNVAFSPNEPVIVGLLATEAAILANGGQIRGFQGE